MYFLDFDRTIFDTDAFYRHLVQHPLSTIRSARDDHDAVEKLVQAVEEGEIEFPEGALARFVFPDAAQFLRDVGNGAMILTFGYERIQKFKVKSALAGIPRIAVMYTDHVDKGDYLAPHIGMYGASPIFVDDTVLQLENMTARCPSVRCFEMRRDGAPGDGRWPVIASLAELPRT